MGFFGKLFRKAESKQTESAAEMSASLDVKTATVDHDANTTAEIMRRTVSLVDAAALDSKQENDNATADDLATDGAEPADEADEESVNIWDIGAEAADADESEAEAKAKDTSAEPAASGTTKRRRRTKTRLIGFGEESGEVVDLFGADTTTDKPQSTKYTVGWLAIVKGPGRGEVFNMQSGMSQIGRGEDQVIQLDFGDDSISRTNHAAVVYDAETHKFFLGHGGKSNVVRLNDTPLISNEMLSQGDLIRIGETTLLFQALCDESFNWDGDEAEESDDVEIA